MSKQTINNGETGLVVRGKLNDNFTELYNKDTSQDTVILNNSNDIADLQAPTFLAFTPQLTAPAHVEGQVYYNSIAEEFRLQGPFPGVEVSVGHGLHTHVINNSGATLTKGTVCRHDGSVGGEVQAVPALADTFAHARVFGVVAEDIAIGARGALIVSGSLSGVDTSAFTEGVPLYVSSTVPGTLTETPPEITTQVGGSLVQSATTGKLYIQIINNTNLPNVYAGLKKLITPLVAVTTTPQDVVGYVTTEKRVMLASTTTGIATLSNTGQYRASVNASISFASDTVTRTLYLQVYDIAGVTPLFTYVKNIARDATLDSISFSYPFSGIADETYKLRVYSNAAISITFTDIVFDIQSISIVE